MPRLPQLTARKLIAFSNEDAGSSADESLDLR